ncbi:hypothetical protein EP331_09965 [bacterium]|nr:MAG: hypothetical protein EP331_09965 [bacterium]
MIIRFCFILGISIWFGALVFFAFGAAGIPFKIANTWSLTGVNPTMPEQIVSYRTVGGAITSQMLIKLNQIEIIALFLTSVALFLAWIPEHNRSTLLLFQTLIMASMGILLLIYMEKIGVRMFEIQSTIPIDFSITDESLKLAAHKEFEVLHKRYSSLVSANAILAFLQILLFSINPLAKVRTN